MHFEATKRLLGKLDFAGVGTPTTIPAALVHAAGGSATGRPSSTARPGGRSPTWRTPPCRSAAAMIAAGVERGDRVAVWAPNGRLFVAAALGAVTAGAVLVPLNTRFKGDEAAWILRRSGARLLVTDNGFLGNDYVAMLARTPSCPSLTRDHHAEREPAVCSWPEFLRRGSGVPRGRGAGARGRGHRGRRLATCSSPRAPPGGPRAS